MTSTHRTGATFARGRSRQDYSTPPELLSAVIARYGALSFDLAATAESAKAPEWYGPGSSLGADSLSQDWTQRRGNLWLNPPFGVIGPWAWKAAESLSSPHRFDRIVMLVPASVGADWYRESIDGHARVLALNGRVTFEGCSTPFPKDLILAVYGEPPGFEVWQWRRQARTVALCRKCGAELAFFDGLCAACLPYWPGWRSPDNE